MKQDNSLIFFEFEDFTWEFIEYPHNPLGCYIGTAVRESFPNFDDFTCTLTLNPRRKYPNSPLDFTYTISWWIDEGNNGRCSTVYPNTYGVAQIVDAALEDAKRHAYDDLRRQYSAREYHLMP
jgi:hypothetical protein